MLFNSNDELELTLNHNKKISFKDNYFDIVTTWDLLEHLQSPSDYLKKISYKVKKNGLILCTTLKLLPHSY